MHLAEAAKLIRNRVVVVENLGALKNFMEASGGGLVARTIVVDISKPGHRQSSNKSAAVCLAPTATMQETWADQIKDIPATPVVGNVLIRPCNHSVDVLEAKLRFTHTHRKSISVPVSTPMRWMRYFGPAGSSRDGPQDDEQNGVDFVLRTIGKRAENEVTGEEIVEQSGPTASGDEAADDAEDDEDMEHTEPHETSAADKAFQQMTDPSLMSHRKLKELFGNRAGDLKNIIFQHSTRISRPAMCLSKEKFFVWRKTETAPPRCYRKGQVDPSVYISALASMLSTSNLPLSPNEILVDLTGGTPEVLVAGIVAGFSKVMYLSGNSEAEMMTMPSQEDERTHHIDYENYMSPSDGAFNMGVLAASSVTTLAPYVANHTQNIANTWKVESCK